MARSAPTRSHCGTGRATVGPCVPAPRGSGRCHDLGVGAEVVAHAGRQENVLIDAPAGHRGARKREPIALVGPGVQHSSTGDAELRVACSSPATTAACLKTSVTDKRLMNVDRVNAEPGRLGGVGKLDPDDRVRPGRGDAGRDFGPPVPTREGPEATEDISLEDRPRSPRVIAPRAPPAIASRDHLGVGAETLTLADGQRDVLVDIATDDRGTGEQLAGRLDREPGMARLPPAAVVAAEIGIVDKICGPDPGVDRDGGGGRVKRPVTGMPKSGSTTPSTTPRVLVPLPPSMFCSRMSIVPVPFVTFVAVTTAV